MLWRHPLVSFVWLPCGLDGTPCGPKEGLFSRGTSQMPLGKELLWSCVVLEASSTVKSELGQQLRAQHGLAGSRVSGGAGEGSAAFRKRASLTVCPVGHSGCRGAVPVPVPGGVGFPGAPEVCADSCSRLPRTAVR